MPAIPSEITDMMADFQTSLEAFKGQMKGALGTLDLTTVAAVLLVIAGVIIVYDLLVYVLASTTAGRSMMVSPFLAKMAAQAWEKRDDFGFSNLIESRSLEDFPSVLDALTLAAEKYDQEEELQSSVQHEKTE